MILDLHHRLGFDQDFDFGLRLDLHSGLVGHNNLIEAAVLLLWKQQISYFFHFYHLYSSNTAVANELS